MKALIQRVKHASVMVSGESVASINAGLLVLLGIDKGDTLVDADKLLKKILAYRVFSDTQGKMNLSLNDTKGGLLLVSQFTLSANTAKGNRPSFTSAAAPDEAALLYKHVCQQAKVLHSIVETGVFGADMQVTLCNDGPVTFLLDV